MHNFTQGESKVVRSRFEVFASAASDVQQFRDHVFLTFMDDMAGVRHDRTPSRSDATRMLRVHKEGAP